MYDGHVNIDQSNKIERTTELDTVNGNKETVRELIEVRDGERW